MAKKYKKKKSKYPGYMSFTKGLGLNPAYGQDGGNMDGMMKARIAYGVMHGNPSAKRMVVPIDNPYIFQGNEPYTTPDMKGEFGTHYMFSEDNYAIPTIQQDSLGNLFYNVNAGPTDKEAMRFESPTDAGYFAENYKSVAPAFRKNGGWLDEFAEGGSMSPLDLNPTTLAKYTKAVMNQENAAKEGFNKQTGKWFPHESVEGGLPTIAYGHKLTSKGQFSEGLTEAEALSLLGKDIKKHEQEAERIVDKKYGKGTFDSLGQDEQMLLTDYSFNGVLSEFPAFTKGVVKGDKDLMRKEYIRYSEGKPLKRRNEWTLGVIENLPTAEEQKAKPVKKALPVKTLVEEKPWYQKAYNYVRNLLPFEEGGFIGKTTVEAGGAKHVVYTGKDNHIMVNHPEIDNGSWDTIDLTEVSGAESLAQGVDSTLDWHRKHPYHKYKKAYGGKLMYQEDLGTLPEEEPIDYRMDEQIGWGYKGDDKYGRFEKPTGEVRYGINPGRAYDVYRTETPYTSKRQIKNLTPTPTSKKDVDYISNLGAARGGLTEDVESGPLSEESHWNIQRFLLEPNISNNFYYERLGGGNLTKQQQKRNILSDIYKNNLLQNQGNRKEAWKDTTKFMRKEINPLMRGEVYRGESTGNRKLTPYGITSFTSGTDEDFFLKQERLKRYGAEDASTKQYLNQVGSIPSDRKVNRYAMDWLTKYKKMPRSEARQFIKDQRSNAISTLNQQEKEYEESKKQFESQGSQFSYGGRYRRPMYNDKRIGRGPDGGEVWVYKNGGWLDEL